MKNELRFCFRFMVCYSFFIFRTEPTTTTGYLRAISLIEQNQVPAVGPTKDRQVLRKLASVYNPPTVRAQAFSTRRHVWKLASPQNGAGVSMGVGAGVDAGTDGA